MDTLDPSPSARQVSGIPPTERYCDDTSRLDLRLAVRRGYFLMMQRGIGTVRLRGGRIVEYDPELPHEERRPLVLALTRGEA